MKAKTRLLAVLLTLLMVVGILPLSLFALDEPLPTGTDGSGEYVNRTQQQIVDEFNRVGMTISKYQSFENLSNETLSGLYNTANQAILGYGQDWSQNGVWVDNAQYNDIDSKKGYINIANPLNAFEIVTEDDGNDAIYFGDVAEGLTGENFFDFNGLTGGTERWQDQYISIDVKMKGDKIASGPFFNIVLRPSGPMFVALLSVNENGELYIGNDVLGKLSKDEYTRVSVMLDRADNKYYVYINDVLANLGGNELFSENIITEYNNIKGSNFTATDVSISSIRVYTVNSTRSSGINEGVYFDNLIWGNRWELRDRDTAEQVLVQSNFANATPGAKVYPNGTLDANSFGSIGTSLVGGAINPDAMVYVDENDDGVVDGIKYTTAPETGGQNFMNITVNSDKTVSYSADYKMGADGLGNEMKLEHDHNRADKPIRQQENIMVIDKAGNIKAYDGAKIGTINTEKYVNIRVDVVANGPKAKTGFVFYYVDHALVYTVIITESTKLNVKDDYVYTRGFRPNYIYDKNQVPNFKEDDLHMTNIVVGYTDDYNHLGSTEVPFAKNPSGFIEKNGVLRYYDGNGGYRTEDFFVGSTKYIVSDDGAIINKVSGVLPERSLDDIRDEFASQGLDATLFNTFDNYSFAEGADAYTFLSEKTFLNGRQASELTSADLSLADGTALHQAVNMQNINAYAEFGHAGLIQIKNFRDCLSIKDDGTGNKAMFYNWAPATTVPSRDTNNDGIADATYNNDVFIDIYHGLPNSYKNQDGNASHDIFLSIDLKMNGKVIPGSTLFGAIYRPEKYSGANVREWVSLSDVGGIYLLNNYGPQSLVGFLSQDEYTRIALATDRLNNKFYVYINDVLVTPDGVEMWSENDVKKMNEVNTRNDITYTASTMPLCSVRALDCSGNTTSDQSRGLWIDNVLVGARIVTKDKTTPVKGYTYDFTALGLDGQLGEPGTRIEKNPNGTEFLGINTDYTSIGRPINDDGTGTIRYVDETGPEGVPDGKADAIEWHKVEGCVDADKPVKDEKDGGGPNPGQAFLGIKNEAPKGSNLRFSMDIKGGIDGQVGNGNLLMFRTGKGTNGLADNRTDVYLSLAADGTLRVNSSTTNAIGQISSDKYTNITVDFVCNSHDGWATYALWYVDGVLMFTQRFDIQNAGNTYTTQDYHPSFVRIYSLYVEDTKQLKDQDIRVRYMSYGTTTDYDVNPTERISVFQNDIEGMFGIGGIVRCYNGDGTYKTDDFIYKGEVYTVSFGGNVIGKESDGRIFAPYAPYTDWAHTGTMVKSSPTGYYISGKGDGATKDNTTITSARDGFWKQGTMSNGDGVMLYTSYNDTEVGVGSPKDHATYITMDFEDKQTLNGLINKSAVIDVDIMLGEMFITKNNGTQPFFYLRGDAKSDNSAGDKDRKDKDFKEFNLGGDGWLLYNGKKLYKFSQTEYTRFSFVVHGPQIDESDNITKPASVDLYANGVLLVAGVQGHTEAKFLRQIRFLKVCDSDLSIYIKDLYMYEAAKPQQFMGMVNGAPALVSDPSVDAATMADMKQGFVKENGVVRYYDELGLPVIDKSFTVDGKTHTADKNGVVETPCVGNTHYGKSLDKGVCDICGTKFDGITALYGNSLILGSDVKVVFYVEVGDDYVPQTETPYMEIGLERDYVNGTTIKDYQPEMVEIDGKMYVKMTYALSGKDICSDVKVRFVDGTFVGTEYVYSAAKYAEEVNALPTDEVYTEELKALANALVVYGRNASVVLNKEGTADVIEDVDFSGVADANGTPDLDGAIKLNKFLLELKSNIKLKVYVKYDEFNMMMTYWEDYIVTVNGEEVTPVLVDEENNIYCIEIDVVAAKLGEIYQIEILHYLNQTGLKFNISALSYAKIMNTHEKASEAEKNLMKAIKLYADAAVAYADGIAEDSRPAV